MSTTKYIVNNVSGQTINGQQLQPYKVYTALLTQSGVDDPIDVGTGLLTVGVTYYIANESIGMDFTNVGAPNNNILTFFVATGTTPNNWGESEGLIGILQYNTGAPVVTVLENTIGNIWFTYNAVGEYIAASDSLFTENKTAQFLNTDYTSDGYLVVSNFNTNSAINLASFDSNGTSTDGLFVGTPIEIRVYN